MLLYRSFGSFFHLVSSVHFIIVELCWHICSKSHFDLSLAFWLWASVISHFPRQQTLRQICVQEYSPDQYLKGVKEAGLGRARGWIAYQLPVKLQQILVNSSWDSHSGLSWAGARDSAFVSQCHSVIGSGVPWEWGVTLGEATLFILAQSLQRDSAETCQLLTHQRAQGIECFSCTGEEVGILSRLPLCTFLNYVCPSSTFHQQKWREGLPFINMLLLQLHTYLLLPCHQLFYLIPKHKMRHVIKSWLLSTYSVPGILLCTLHVLSYLIFQSYQISTFTVSYYLLHEEAEAWPGAHESFVN